MTNQEGKSLTIFADRCGGATAHAVLSDKDGNEVFRSTLPDDELAKEVKAKMEAHPDVMPYFWQQEADYRNLKVELPLSPRVKSQGLGSWLVSKAAGGRLPQPQLRTKARVKG